MRKAAGCDLGEPTTERPPAPKGSGGKESINIVTLNALIDLVHYLEEYCQESRFKSPEYKNAKAAIRLAQKSMKAN